MDKIVKVKSISIWIFVVPFIALNACLILITQFHDLFPNKEDIILNSIPYIDGHTSISRTARVFPTYLIFKPAMFLTSFLLIKYWLFNKEIVQHFKGNHKYVKKFVFFGVGSALTLIVHSIFLGIEFDNNLYKLFRRLVMLIFIIFEVAAQAYLISALYSYKDKLLNVINFNIFNMIKPINFTIIKTCHNEQ